MNIGIKRRKIEDKIVASYNAVNFNAKNSAWVDSDVFEDFIFSFFDLRKYYENSDDTTIGTETLRVYMEGLRALQTATENRRLKVDRRDSAARLIYELNYQVEAVMYEVDQNRQAGNPPTNSDNSDSSGGMPVLA